MILIRPLARIKYVRPYSVSKYVSQQQLKTKSTSQYLKDYQQWFPEDKTTNSLIKSYERLKSYPQETIKVGIIYHDETIKQDSKLLETILADPLASNNKSWFNDICTRNKQQNIMFEYEPNPDIIGTKYRIPSPILSSITRPRYMNPNSNITQNDIQIYEINNVAGFDKFNLCHFFIYVSNKLTSIQKLPESIDDRILMTIIDNSDFTPSSSESTPVPLKRDRTSQIVKIHSQKSFDGIMDFLEHDIQASNNYLKSLVESNVFQVLKILGYNLQIENLINWNLSKIIDDIKREEIKIGELEALYTDLKLNQINQFSSSMHEELQNQFGPNITTFFNKQLRWWKLYWKNDNVEYDIKDFLSVKFMPKSIENYNFMRGKIINQLQNHQFVHYSRLEPQQVVNPLLALKNELINKRITREIQPIVSSALFYGLIYYQLPVSIISILAYQVFDFSLNSSVAIFGLGMVMGLNYVSKQWETFTRTWLKTLMEEIRICLDRDCVDKGLVRELSNRYNEEKKIVEIKTEIINGISERNAVIEEIDSKST